MTQCARYTYWLSNGEIIKNYHQENSPANEGDIYLGKWYTHEKTPYLFGGAVVRDYYSKKEVFFYFIDGDNWFGLPDSHYYVVNSDNVVGLIDTDSAIEMDEKRTISCLGDKTTVIFWNNDAERWEIEATEKWIKNYSGLFCHIENKKSPNDNYSHPIGQGGNYE